MFNSYIKHKGIAINIWLITSGGENRAPKIKQNTMFNDLYFFKLFVDINFNFKNIKKIKGNWKQKIKVKKILVTKFTYSIILPSNDILNKLLFKLKS